MGKTEGREGLEGPDLEGRIMLRWIVREWDLGDWSGSSWLRIGTVRGNL